MFLKAGLYGKRRQNITLQVFTVIDSNRAEGHVANHIAFCFSHQGDSLRRRFFGKQTNGKPADYLPFAFSEGRPVDAVNIASINTCRYSYMHDLPLTTGISGKMGAQRPFCPTACPCYVLPILDRHDIICTWAFLALTNFKLNLLTVIKRRVIATAFNFRMMDKEIFSSILGRDETIAFTSIEPFNCTFAHFQFLIFFGE